MSIPRDFAGVGHGGFGQPRFMAGLSDCGLLPVGRQL